MAIPSSQTHAAWNGDVPEPFDEPMQAMRYYVQKRARPGESFVPSDQYVAARRHMATMPRHRQQLQATRVANTVHPMGTLGSATALGPGNIGGRTRSFLIDPTNPNVMFAGAVAGGVWKTTDAGASWQPVADAMSNLTISTMAMSPGNSATIYAGTGEGYFNWDAVRGDGIFFTTDGGSTWSQLSSTHANPDFYYVNKIVISNVNTSRVYAATNTGLFRSMDGGNTWLKILTPSGDGCQDLAIRNDQATDYLFAACGQFSTATIYRSLAAESTDNGGLPSWTPVNSESRMGRTSMAIAPSNQNVIYALSDSLDNTSPYFLGLLAVYRSVDGGSTWFKLLRNDNATLLNTLLLSNPYEGACQNIAANQGWYDNVIAVDPVDSNRVWAGGIDLFRSDDGGQNWGLVSYWWADPSAPQYSHADHHAIVFHPQYDGVNNKVMFDANDGGLFQLADARVATSTNACSVSGNASWTTLNHQYATAQFYHGLPYPGGAAYFGGTQDNGTLGGSDSAGAQNWSRLFGGDGGFVAVDPTNTNNLFTETPYMHLLESNDGGATFFSVGAYDAGAYFIAPIQMDPGNPSIVWSGGSRLWRLSGYVALDFSGTPGSFSAIALEPGNRNHVLGGKGTGFIYNIQDAYGAPVMNYAIVQPRAAWVSSIVFDPTNTQIVYATYSSFGGGHVYKSTNGGTSWFNIDGSGSTRIPDVPVNGIVVDLYNPAHLYIATDVGIFTSLNGGGTSSTAAWAVESTGIPAVPIESLSVDGNTNTLFAFSHGRGVWRMPLTATGTTPVPKVGSLTPNRILQGTQGFPLMVAGSAFVPASVVQWNGSARPTTYVSPTLLVANISASDVSVAGTYSVTVNSPGPGGGTSNVVSFPLTSSTAFNSNVPSPLMISTFSAQVNTTASVFDGYNYYPFMVYARYSTSPDFTNSQTTTPALVLTTLYYSPFLTGLTPQTTYYFRFEATPTIYSTTNSFTTAAVPVLATTGPNFVGSDFAVFGCTAHWPGVYDATLWMWDERSNDPGFSASTIAPLAAEYSGGGPDVGLYDAPDGILLPNTTYYYRCGSNLQNSYTGPYAQISSSQTFTTKAILPTTTAATNPTDTSAQLNGTLDTGSGRYISGWFRWGLNSDLSGGATTAPQSFYVATTLQNLSASLTGLTPGTTYYYRLESSSRTSSQTGAILSFTTTGSSPKKRRGQVITQ